MNDIHQQIKDSGLKFKKVAELLRIDRTTLFKKLNGSRKFTDEELKRLSIILRPQITEDIPNHEFSNK